MTILTILIRFILPFYIIPMIWDIFYLGMQYIEDKHRVEKKAFKNNNDLKICLLATLIPFFNIFICFIGITVVIKSILK